MSEEKNTAKKPIAKKIEAKGIEATEFKGIEGKFLLVKVGTEAKPATEEQIKDIKTQLTDLFEENHVDCLTYVTHHAVDITII